MLMTHYYLLSTCKVKFLNFLYTSPYYKNSKFNITSPPFLVVDPVP